MYILGVKVDNISIREALNKVSNFLIDNKQHYIVTPNPEIILKAQKDAELKNILNKADLAIPDGFGLILASKFLGQPLKERVSGTDLMREICLDEQFKNYKIFLLGGKNGAAKLTIDNLSKFNSYSYNNGRSYESNSYDYNRYNCEEDLEKAVGAINSFQPDILFVGLGAPKQEKWIADNLAKIPSVKLAIAVGGAFDMLSGRIPRAPLFLRKLGLEWMWRLILQPWRVGRIFNAVVIFPVKVMHFHFKIKI